MSDSLRDRLNHEPVPVKFGTSGRRGPVVHLTQLEIYINAIADLEHLQSLPKSEGGITRGDEFYLAFDLRPSSSRFVSEQQGRGEIVQAVQRAVIDAGMKPVNLGSIPTPALSCYAFQQGKGSIMVTGSHIPFDLNGYKTNRAGSELAKSDEEPILRRVAEVRARLYAQRFSDSIFDEDGRFKQGHLELLPETYAGRANYLRRYTGFYSERCLAGKRLLVYQHSAVGRDLLVELLRAFDAEVIPAGRSDTFVPIDTENIDASQLERIQRLVDEASSDHGRLDAVVSTDGDSDRPMILTVENGRVRFFPGDLVGIVVAESLGADAVVVPISCNDAIDHGNLRGVVEPKTRIGSPFVVAGMEAARARGRTRVCGWEANGGFLLGSDVTRGSMTLKSLMTRDAVLPILEVLFAAVDHGLSLHQLFDRLPKRFSRAGLLKDCPREKSEAALQRFSIAGRQTNDVHFNGDGAQGPAPDALRVRRELQGIFSAPLGFGSIIRLNYTDGIRVYFDNGDIAHIRPSGNADELRIYGVAGSQVRADSIVSAGVAEPDGILRRFVAN